MPRARLAVLALALAAPPSAVALAANPALAPVFAAQTHQGPLSRSVAAQMRAAARAQARAAARARARRAARLAAQRPTLPAILVRIAQCESGDNPQAIGGGGAYRGKYQFDYGTWASVGGSGDPAAAPEAEQDRRALLLYRRSGTAPWPVCGR
jgi:hypothetical protein